MWDDGLFILQHPELYPEFVVEKAWKKLFHKKGQQGKAGLDELRASLESVQSVWAEWVKHLSNVGFTHITTLTLARRRFCGTDCRDTDPDDPAHRRAYGCGVPGVPTTAAFVGDFLTHCERAFVIAEYGKANGRRHLHALATFRVGSGTPSSRWPAEVGYSRQEVIRSSVGAIGYVCKTLVHTPEAQIWAKGLT